jgi:predicted nucleic acid-binding Zn ribbon protein
MNPAGKGINFELGEDPDMACVAQMLRTAAAVAQEDQHLVWRIIPSTARRFAHHLDGGGYHAQSAAEMARVTAEADRKIEADARLRAAWVTNCHEILAKARRANRKARAYFAASVALFLASLVFLNWP